jgi:thiaminase (transcriptional activator TenA)
MLLRKPQVTVSHDYIDHPYNKIINSANRPPQYDAWIDMYGGDEFGANVREYIALVDTACATASEDTLNAMQKHFNMACKLEHMFWDQANDMMAWPEVLTSTTSGN